MIHPLLARQHAAGTVLPPTQPLAQSHGATKLDPQVRNVYLSVSPVIYDTSQTRVGGIRSIHHGARVSFQSGFFIRYL